MESPKLFTSTYEILQMGPVTTRPRSHADLIRTFRAALAELSEAGVLVEKPAGFWFAGSTAVAHHGKYKDAYGRSQDCIYFGSWLCLAMSLKVSHIETRAALMTLLRQNPIY